MHGTEFPSRPCDVAALTISEFTFELDMDADVSFDGVCRRFVDDANRAVVWLIRFRALNAWRARDDVEAWLHGSPSRATHACEIAASFDLNPDWEFDAEAFRSAVEIRGHQFGRP
jgi:hypothetical protein